MGSINNHKNPLLTPLFLWHKEHGGQMSTFGGYTMPLWYESGVRAEHLAVLSSAGLFDTCHMSSILVRGQDSLDLLQDLFSRDINRCSPDRSSPLQTGCAVYGVFLQENGHLIDDAIIFRLGTDKFMVCVNSGKGVLISEHLHSSKRWQPEITDLTGSLAKIDLQGPAAVKILSRLVKDEKAVFASFAPFTCKGNFDQQQDSLPGVSFKSGLPVLISRSGYTGELGFELFTPSENVVDLWQEIISAGEDGQVVPCGLAARDSLRTGAGLPLAGNDIGDWPFIDNPWPFALPYTNDGKSFTKRFTGSRALLQSRGFNFTYPFAGFDLRKIEPGAGSTVINSCGEEVGKALTCVTDMAIDRVGTALLSINSPGKPNGFKPKGISCGFIITTQKQNYGNILTLKDKRREIRVEITREIRPDRTARLPLKDFLGEY